MCEQGHGGVAVDEEHEHGAAAQAGKQALAPGRAAHAAHIPHGRVQRPLARRGAVPVKRLQAAVLTLTKPQQHCLPTE